MHLFTHLSALVLLSISLASAIPSSALLRPAPGSITISNLTLELSGNGCAPNSVSATLAADNSALTLIFDAFTASDGPKAISAHTRALCKVNLGMSLPGWAFDVSSVDFRGYVYLETGVNASLVSRWKWVDGGGTGLPGKGNVQRKLTGPFTDDVLLHKEGEKASSEASICQKKDVGLHVTLSVTVDAGTLTQNGYVQGSSSDAAFKEGLNMSWRKC